MKQTIEISTCDRCGAKVETPFDTGSGTRPSRIGWATIEIQDAPNLSPNFEQKANTLMHFCPNCTEAAILGTKK